MTRASRPSRWSFAPKRALGPGGASAIWWLAAAALLASLVATVAVAGALLRDRQRPDLLEVAQLAGTHPDRGESGPSAGDAAGRHLRWLRRRGGRRPDASDGPAGRGHARRSQRRRSLGGRGRSRCHRRGSAQTSPTDGRPPSRITTGRSRSSCPPTATCGRSMPSRVYPCASSRGPRARRGSRADRTSSRSHDADDEACLDALATGTAVAAVTADLGPADIEVRGDMRALGPPVTSEPRSVLG